jgi:cyclophilin family peptidyl-prolyl cis-trans isomerase
MKASTFYILSIIISLISSVETIRAELPFKLPDNQSILRIRSAIIYTYIGNIYIRLFPESAPIHVANFKFLADQGFYKNLPFHIHEPGYVIQTGAPNRKANSGPGYTIAPEFNSLKHLTGTLSMVRKPNDLDLEHKRESHGSQFRIILRDSPHLDGQFTVFGKVMKGIDIAKQLKLGDRIKNIKVFVKKD